MGHQSVSNGSASGVSGRWLKAVTILLAVIYLVNCCTPLRVHVDMLRFFAKRDCLDLGCPLDSVAGKDYMPWGYTFLLYALSKVGLLKSWSIVLINCVYLGGSLWLVARLFRRMIRPWLLAVLVLLNWTTIKFTIHPLSEMQYLFFSIAALYLLQQYLEKRRLGLLAGALSMGALAFITRSVGVALAGTLVLGLLWVYREAVIGLIRRNWIVPAGVVVVLAGVVIFSRQLGLNHYSGVFTRQFKEGLTVSTLLRWHFTEWAELCLNVSMVKVSGYLPVGVGQWLFLLSGIVFFGGFVYLLITTKRVPLMVRIYLALYSLVMFDWPFYDPRFWVPVVPLVVAVVLQRPAIRKSWAKVCLGIYLTAYSISGLVSSGYLTYTSLNKEVMARTHANGVYRNEYETLFYGKPQSDTARSPLDPAVLSVLKRYDR